MRGAQRDIARVVVALEQMKRRSEARTEVRKEAPADATFRGGAIHADKDGEESTGGRGGNCDVKGGSGDIGNMGLMGDIGDMETDGENMMPENFIPERSWSRTIEAAYSLKMRVAAMGWRCGSYG